MTLRLTSNHKFKVNGGAEDVPPIEGGLIVVAVVATAAAAVVVVF